MTAPLLSMTDIRARYMTNGRPASRTYIYTCEQSGDLPRSILVGGKRFWRLADVVALEDKRFAEAAQKVA